MLGTEGVFVFVLIDLFYLKGRVELGKGRGIERDLPPVGSFPK